MQGRADLPLDVRRRFLTGRVSLDFSHTGGDGDWAVWEILHTPADLSHWLGVILSVDGLSAGGPDLAAARPVRMAIAVGARSLAAGRSVSASDVAVLNAAAAAPPLVPQLTPSGMGVSFEAPTAAAALSTLARDAIDLFSGPWAGRIRVCAAADCGLLLVDTSRPGQRRWCSMQRCGNLAKVRGHRRRAT
ncbi:CGNR zinc finger domain-containing protein [Jiangella mangrovi]|uniref:Putative RNA-binding Zn ribbon-like protein n=1 Tax=Jiangella mangrovi TaxID=1524084 RepID=A0A7W9GLA1_9ACTN|nr:CGNR zinc finger domain-containing protein [Jiangella mangrovi]MBB5785975.1 putative RNA-binding Zn ribbon-like protein [Jiangella mangrovi]